MMHQCSTIMGMMQDRPSRTPVGVRVDLDLLHKARIAAVTQRKTLGKWLEEATEDNLKREVKRGPRSETERIGTNASD